jgi:hypothetical protein
MVILAMTCASDKPVLLRRSIIGSLRSASPFLSPTTAVSQILGTDSQETGRDTPVSTKEILAAISEHERLTNPQLDRSVDLFVISNLPIDQEGIFSQIVSNHQAVREDHPLFSLPVTVRRKFYSYCFPDEPRKISLSPRFATKAVFPDGYFISPWDILEPVLGGLHAFRQLRHELMTYFWTKYHFHVTLSPFTGPKFSPLSHVWLVEYLDIIQYLTIEVDLTRFGFSALRVASEFGHDVNKTENLVLGVVIRLLKRGKATMAELNLMCRRYAGFRPYNSPDNATFEFEPGKF